MTFPLMNLAAAFGSLVGVGASTLVAIKLGQKDKESATHVLGNVIVLNIIIGALFMVLMLIFLKPVLLFFGASPETITLCGRLYASYFGRKFGNACIFRIE